VKIEDRHVALAPGIQPADHPLEFGGAQPQYQPCPRFGAQRDRQHPIAVASDPDFAEHQRTRRPGARREPGGQGGIVRARGERMAPRVVQHDRLELGMPRENAGNRLGQHGGRVFGHGAAQLHAVDRQPGHRAFEVAQLVHQQAIHAGRQRLALALRPIQARGSILGQHRGHAHGDKKAEQQADRAHRPGGTQ